MHLSHIGTCHEKIQYETGPIYLTLVHDHCRQLELLLRAETQTKQKNKEFLIKRSHSCSSIGDCRSKDISTLNSTSCIEIVSKLLINALTENEKFIPRRKIYSHSSVHCAKGKTSKDLLLLLMIKLLF